MTILDPHPQPHVIIAEEAIHLLQQIMLSIHVSTLRGKSFVAQLIINSEVFERLCVWGSAFEDFEDDAPLEDSGDAELENWPERDYV